MSDALSFGSSIDAVLRDWDFAESGLLPMDEEGTPEETGLTTATSFDALSNFPPVANGPPPPPLPPPPPAPDPQMHNPLLHNAHNLPAAPPLRNLFSLLVLRAQDACPLQAGPAAFLVQPVAELHNSQPRRDYPGLSRVDLLVRLPEGADCAFRVEAFRPAENGAESAAPVREATLQSWMPEVVQRLSPVELPGRPHDVPFTSCAGVRRGRLLLLSLQANVAFAVGLVALRIILSNGELLTPLPTQFKAKFRADWLKKRECRRRCVERIGHAHLRRVQALESWMADDPPAGFAASPPSEFPDRDALSGIKSIVDEEERLDARLRSRGGTLASRSSSSSSGSSVVHSGVVSPRPDELLAQAPRWTRAREDGAAAMQDDTEQQPAPKRACSQSQLRDEEPPASKEPLPRGQQLEELLRPFTENGETMPQHMRDFLEGVLAQQREREQYASKP